MMQKDEQKARELLVEYGRRLLADGLVQGTWGNISVRLDEEYMLCTPSGLDYDRVGPEDMVKVHISDLEYEGETKPTSEKGLHAGIYELRPEAGAVIHTHSKYCSIFAAADMPLPVEDPDAAAVLGDVIHIAGYGLPGTRKLMKNTIRAVGEGVGAIMAHHGMICCGTDIEDAYQKCNMMEQAAHVYIDKRFHG